MDCSMSHSCSCRINMGCGLLAVLSRVGKGKKKEKKNNKMVSVGIQTDADLIDILVARRWGERTGNQGSSMRVVPPPPPPDRKPGIHNNQTRQASKSTIGPFAPTLDELLKGKALLKKIDGSSDAVSKSSKGVEDKKSMSDFVMPKSSSAPPKNAPSVSEIVAGEQITAN